MRRILSGSVAAALALAAGVASPLRAQMDMQHPMEMPAGPLGIPETRMGSGSQEVPDPIRVSGMPRGPAGISMGCCISICARSGDATPAASASAAATEPLRILRISTSPQAKVEARVARAARTHCAWDDRLRLEAVARGVG